MRFALGVLLSLSACAEISGLDGLGVCDGACVDATVDAPQSAEAGADANDSGTITVDAGPTDVVSDVAPPLPDATTPCNQPGDCKNGQVCCETILTKGNQYPNCAIDADTVACASGTACPTTIPTFSCGTYLFRRCAAATDCTEQNAPKCCTFKLEDAGEREACLSTLIASITDASCL